MSWSSNDNLDKIRYKPIFNLKGVKNSIKLIVISFQPMQFFLSGSYSKLYETELIPSTYPRDDVFCISTLIMIPGQQVGSI